MRREFSRPVSREIVARATNERGEICCEQCGLVLAGKPYEIDHTIAEQLVPEWKKDKPLTAKEGQLLGKFCCHRGPDGKTAKDVAKIAKAKRQGDKHARIVKPTGKLNGRGFPKSKPPREPKAMPPRRNIFTGEVVR